MVVVVVVVGSGGGGWVGGGGFGWVGGGLGTVVVGRGRVDGGLVVVGGDVGGGAVVVVGGGTIWARACQMAAAPKAMVTSTTIPAARQRALTLVCVLPASVVCLLADICYLAHSR